MQSIVIDCTLMITFAWLGPSCEDLYVWVFLVGAWGSSCHVGLGWETSCLGVCVMVKFGNFCPDTLLIPQLCNFVFISCISFLKRCASDGVKYQSILFSLILQCSQLDGREILAHYWAQITVRGTSTLSQWLTLIGNKASFQEVRCRGRWQSYQSWSCHIGVDLSILICIPWRGIGYDET